MKAYCISYDLKSPNKDYKGLYDAIKMYPWWHFLESTWLIKTGESPVVVWNHLAKHIDTNDRILIIEVRDNVQGWLAKAAWEWIHENVPK